MDKAPPGFLIDTRWLKAQGINSKSIHDYVARGWLERVAWGVYRRPLPEGVRAQGGIPWESVVLSLQWIMKYDIHLGGVSALDLAAGYAHYLHLGGIPSVHLYGNAPSWLRRLPANAEIIVHRRTLFGKDQTGIINANRDVGKTGHDANVWRWPLKVSSPERAILEALNEASSATSFDNLDKIFESLITLRHKQLMVLLTACRSVKVRRLFFVLADRHQHAWRKHLDSGSIDFGSGPRALFKGGKLHPEYHIYVPRDFIPEKEGADADV